MKILLIVIDGLGDEPIPQLGNKTPLESANTPNLDRLAREGAVGLVTPCSSTALPTSEESHLALFGYNPKKLSLRRGIFTARGAGMKVEPGDVALRGNFGTVDENMNMIDRRAGRIKNAKPLIKSLNGRVVDDVRFSLKSATEHRVGIVMKGENLSSKISDGDPHYSSLGKKAQKIVPLDKKSSSAFTAKVLNEFLSQAHEILKDHPLNEKRKDLGLPVANYILTRGASSPQEVTPFKERYGLSAACVAGKLLYQQIAQTLGMKIIKVRGANGLPSTNLKGKFSAVKKALKRHDFLFLHIKATDSLAEDGDFLGKRRFIEKIDQNMEALKGLKETLVVTADHSTCSLEKRHCQRPIPLLVFGAKKDQVSEFSERECQNGSLGKFKQTSLMKKILGLAS